MSNSTVPKDKQASSRDTEAETQLDASVSTHDGDEEESAESPTPEPDDESDEEVLRSIGSVKGEELLAFFDEVRNAYQIDTSSLSLPQLVAVGGTSCGKSSLLQALTKLPFPVDNGICTLFATETTIHRCDPSKDPHYTITIHSKGVGAPFLPRKYSNESWQNVSHHLKKDLEDVFAKQHAQYETPGGLDGNAGRGRLHEQVMRVNVYKHDQAHFSVVDIPGLISGGSRADQELSESLARQYMKNPHAIVLAVMPAVDNILNQAVLRLAMEEGAMSRTIGVVTKCDMLQKNDEPKTIELLKNQKPDYKLDLGWFAVRNRTTEEVENGLTYRERDDKEHRLFSQRPWSSLNGFVGIDNLNERLADTLYKHVKKSFPRVQKDIIRKLREAKEDLDMLGPSRDSEKMQSLYLDDIQRQYKDLAQRLLAGIYKENCPLEDPSRLRNHLGNLHEEFRRNIEQHGMEIEYPSHEGAANRIAGLKPDSPDWEADIMAKDDMFSWILRVWNENRGDGLSHKPPPYLDELLWKTQIQSWGKFANEYFHKALELIQAFSDTLLEDVCPDSLIRGKICQYLEGLKIKATVRGKQELGMIVSEVGIMKSCHQGYKEQLETVQQGLNVILKDFGDNKLRHVFATFLNLSEFQQMAQWRFIDNLIIQVVERHLLGASGLVFCFNTEWVRNLSKDQLDYLVGEDERRKERRANLETQIRDLGEILRQAEALQTKR
ncbi:uncharacterized protein N7503_004751 [Penicillium pulvis]|uniref:uncharacterized protein n=1 Tax=Penicillium pulvis TaxID=1562058 RepID=UPI0025468188|nr:uncharacterized protein N7503_004751 [Penicillium pulvis]KAJ5802301.1 hypothetical protein N7503_004751 [Penicillium pulvis]